MGKGERKAESGESRRENREWRTGNGNRKREKEKEKWDTGNRKRRENNRSLRRKVHR